MKCTSCGAPLPPDSLVCAFCQTRNSLDLRGLGARPVERPGHARDCPACQIPMTSLNVGLREVFLIEQCPRCQGLFFDLNELQTLLDDGVARVHEVDHQLLTALSNQSVKTETKISYKPCPDCQELMNRVNFGPRSGVVVDRCRNHGVWLDAGELRRLLEWKKAGGQLVDRQPELSPGDARKVLDSLTEPSTANELFRRIGRLLNTEV
jgi:Zn-finger nucleic acid-binding protein